MIQNTIDTQQNAEYQKLETPSLINTRQGVSVLYKDHYLYSKYDPSKAILNIISNTTIPEYSIVLIFSPVLWLGLKELLEKLPETSYIAAFEFDSNLFDFAKSYISEELKNTFNNKIQFFNKNNISSYYNFIQNNHFRKTVKIDFSAGSAFYKNEYDQIFSITHSVIDQFWKNRLTLIKFGRLFSKNIFKNLSLLPSSVPLQTLKNSVDKPIIVLGAGESLNETILQLKNVQNNFYIIAVDAAAAPLFENGIKPDAIIAVEGQQVIEKAYIGKPADSGTLLIMDLVSRNHIPYITKGNYSFFLSKYAEMDFLNNLDCTGILPPVIKPLGSVGLVAMEIALKLRKDTNTAIYFSGLDFSYSTGITHAKGTPSHKNHLRLTDKLHSLFNFASSFENGTSKIISKDSATMITSKSLEGYAMLFSESFCDAPAVFDIGKTGIDLKLKKLDFNSVIKELNSSSEKKTVKITSYDKEMFNNVSDFLNKEEKALSELKDLFSFGEKSEYRNNKISLSDQINNIIKSREYLYIHFPDAVGPTNIQSFYNRIRIELDFFQKEIQTAKAMLK